MNILNTDIEGRDLIRNKIHHILYNSFQRLSDKVAISYQVTAEGGPGGVVSARDFIFIFKNEYNGDAYVQGGCSVDFPGPKSSKIVRWDNFCIFGFFPISILKWIKVGVVGG